MILDARNVKLIIIPIPIEYEMFKNEISFLENEFKIRVEVQHIQNSTYPKAKKAKPGKPALIVERTEPIV